ncbi:MAG: hypothetical protein MZV64_43375 [Ignavibacteriales bacterium]|nr:hypothetical protein [Ignavibacteriales bacterium]
MHGISSHTILDWVKEMAVGEVRGPPDRHAELRRGGRVDGRPAGGWRLKPAGDEGTYYQKFPNPYTLVKPGAELDAARPGCRAAASIVKRYVVRGRVLPGLDLRLAARATAEVVYVGYGITAPELGYDDYAGVDVKGKFVAFEPEVPMGPEPDAELFKKWRPYSFHDYKMKNAAAARRHRRGLRLLHRQSQRAVHQGASSGPP